VWLLFLLSLADWTLLRTNLLRHPPWVLAALVGATVLALATVVIVAVVDLALARGPRGRGAATFLLSAGCLIALAAGSLNWLLSLQGFVILHEGEVVPLHGGSHLERLASGPLSDLREIHLSLGLEEVEIVAAGEGFFFPRSRLAVLPEGGERVSMVIDPRTAGELDSLRFYQGAFGFAPQIVILKDDRTVLDRVVPFTTRRDGPAGIAFEGRFTVESDDLAVEGRVDLDSLDQALRGHATLDVSVSRGGKPLGRGSLSPGHFAEIGEGYRLGFVGLEKWSEIDISRRNYAPVVLAGAAIALLGAVAWPVARWRNR
jgi:hypothetical protein